ncbi:class I SAM-dependent methyltransferase [Streptomyces sp. V3I7]|uniref:class I SAM-dependent methyltransferase n=1 Tax=Streptomyces sp. V3I7 TaxID=3042278 RepID=UPI00278B4B80|nr:class I SAM-dependent methyltransferase [Streptomyces sp. V3I7]MDQ0991130.1 SAM-dependent methyltransferase [Streptomyces sp. V3I7]
MDPTAQTAPTPRQPRTGDAFGRILARCWAAGAAPWSAVEVIERDDGFVAAHDAARYFREPGQWSALDTWAWGQATGRILDVGCGGGRHAVPWRARGHEVLGLDPSPEAVRITRERGVDATVGSVSSLPAGLGEFDTIALFGNNLGLLGGPAQAPRVLASLAAVARPGALLIGTGTDPGDGGPVHAAYHAWNLDRGRPRGQLRLRVRDGVTATPWFDYWLAAPAELEPAIAVSPWTLETLESDPSGAGYVMCLRRK